MLKTTGMNFEGYHVEQYIDVLSEEVIFKNSFMKKLFASVGDIFSSLNLRDTEMSGATSLIENGKRYVMERFTKKAENMGGNAILGMQFDTSFGVEIIRISVSGTIVRIAQDEHIVNDKKTRIPVKGSNHVELKCTAAIYHKTDELQSIALDIFNPHGENISGVKCDLFFRTAFGDCIMLKDQMFIKFTDQNGHHQLSEPLICELSDDRMKAVETVDIIVKKYIVNGNVIDVMTKDISSIEELDQLEKASAPRIGFKEIMSEAEKLETAKEIYEYVQTLAQADSDAISQELIEKLKNLSKTERLYGNEKDESIKTIQKFYQK